MTGRLVWSLPVLLLVPAAAAQGQRGDTLPSVVGTAFHQAYPSARILHVSRELQEGQVVYEIESQDGSMRRDLLYGVDAQTLEIEEILPADSVPAVVRAAVQRDLAGAAILGGERIMRGAVTVYEVQIRKGGRTEILTYDPAGVRKE